MNLIKRISKICWIFCLVSYLPAQEVDYSGTSVANFLKIGMGARQVAMADAAIAVVDDANSLFWNPAAATRVTDFGSASISYMNWLVDTQISYISGVLNLDAFGYLGFDLMFMDYGNIEETTVYDQDGTGRFVDASDMSVGLAYSRKLTERFSFGFKAKYVAEKLAGVTADAFAFDIGTDFQTSFFDNNLRLAAVVSNFGTKMKFSGRDLSVIYTVPGSPSSKQIPANLETLNWELPLLFRFGISNYFINNEDFSALLAYDILDSRDYDVRHNVGAEVGYQQLIYLRGGYKFNYDEVTYTAGLGIDLTRILGYKLRMDYVFLDYGVFSTLHQFSFAVNF
jgi:hypothetical protein